MLTPSFHYNVLIFQFEFVQCVATELEQKKQHTQEYKEGASTCLAQNCRAEFLCMTLSHLQAGQPHE